MSKEELSPEDQQLIDGYLADMIFRELASTTIKLNRYNLSNYARNVGIHADNVIELRRKFQLWLMRETLQPQTRSLWITQVHCFYAWCNREGYFRRVEAPNGALIDFDPTIGITRPKSRKGTPHPIDEDELSNALQWADIRMKCWLLIGAMCGARCKEIAGVRREDVQPEIDTLHLEFTKGNKPRDVDLPPEVLEALNEYGMPESGPLWDVTAEDVSRQISKYLHDLGSKATAHWLRHRFGTVFYQATGGDSFLTAEVMGHSDPSITRTYAAPDRTKAASARANLRVKTASTQVPPESDTVEPT